MKKSADFVDKIYESLCVNEIEANEMLLKLFNNPFAQLQMILTSFDENNWIVSFQEILHFNKMFKKENLIENNKLFTNLQSSYEGDTCR